MVIDAIPYPWPYHGRLAAHTTALVLIAAQQAFVRLDPGGRVRDRCVALRRAAHRAGMSLCLVRLSRSAASSSRAYVLPHPFSAGWAPLAGCGPDRQTLVADSPGLDGFYGTALDAALWHRGIRNLILAGFGTETAVHSTLRSANDRGFECLTIEDACADVDPDVHAASMSTIMMSGGIFGAYAPAASVLSALNGLAESALPEMTTPTRRQGAKPSMV